MESHPSRTGEVGQQEGTFSQGCVNSDSSSVCSVWPGSSDSPMRIVLLQRLKAVVHGSARLSLFHDEDFAKPGSTSM